MKKLLLAMVLLVGMNGATFGFATVATAINGDDIITFTSNTSDVSVLLNDVAIGTLDDEFKYLVKRDGKPKIFKFKKAGYETEVVQLTTSFDGLFWGNLLSGGSVGSSTDSWFTKNAYEYSPSQYYIELSKN